MASNRFPPRDPNALLDYLVDWSPRLVDGDTISGSTWTAPAGIVIESDSFTGTTTSVWLSGGTDGEIYVLTNHIVTAQGREDERDYYFPVKNL